MASFTDQIPQFNPYIQQMPVEAMTQVGVYKQQKYDEGLQKIQSQIDNIAGFDVVRDVDKQYLQSKLNELGGKLKTVAAGDFSNFQLVNSVGGMATQIGKDPYVVDAILSTSKYRKEVERMQKEIDEGKSDPSNIAHFNKNANKWLSSGKLGDTFSASYKKHFDVNKFVKETFDAVLPDQYKFDQIFQLDEKGNPIITQSVDKNGKVVKSLVYSKTMTRTIREGKFPKKVQETLNQIFSDPRVTQQLQITGEYNYKNIDSLGLIEKLKGQKEETINTYEDKLIELGTRKKAGEDVQSEIDAIEERLSAINTNYDQYIRAAEENPDAVRGNLYTQEVRDRYVTMFGQIKSEQQILENPAARFDFELQKEANAQSRWVQDAAFNRQKFAVETDLKKQEMKQRWDIATLNASVALQKKGAGNTGGFGVPKDASNFEQGQEFSAIDVVNLAEQDYNNAADDFVKNSTSFIWNNSGLDAIPNNQKRLQTLMNSGKTLEEAQYSIFKELADRRKIPVDQFMMQYTNQAVKAYNNLTPEQKQKNPSLVDQYNSFVKSERNFKSQATIQKSIEDQTAQLYGNSASVNSLTKDITDKTYKLSNGKEIVFTKQDMYDLALYLKGHTSVVGTLSGVDPIVRKASKSAEKRLIDRGKGEFLDAVLLDNLGIRSGYGARPITFANDLLKGVWSGVKSGVKTLLYSDAEFPRISSKDQSDLLSNVDKVYKNLSEANLPGILEGKAEVIKKAYGLKPNLKTSVFSGDADEDRQTLYNVKRWAGEYGTKSGEILNYSSDFKNFKEALGDVKEASGISLSAQPIVGADGQVRVEIVAFGEDLKRKGGMTIQPDEAAKIGIDLNTLYETREVSTLRNYINYNKGKSLAGDPTKLESYIQGDAYFKGEDDFKNLNRSGYSAMGNIIKKNGVYYPYIFVTDGKNYKIRELTGSPNLASVQTSLLDVNPTFVQAILNGY